MMTIDKAKKELSKLIKQKRLIIFVGSGISIDSGLPNWTGFLDSFIDFCKGLQRDYNNQEIVKSFQSELFDDAHNEKIKKPAHVATVLKSKIAELPESIRSNIENDFRIWFFNLFATSKPNQKHEWIAGTNFPYVLTSNYDLLLETAAKNIGSPYASLSFHEKERIAEALYTKTPSIIHVHGKYQDVLFDKIIFTAEDYIRIIKKGYPGFSFALQSLFLNYSTLFVGYGASDPHLEDLMEEFSYYFDYTKSVNVSKNYLVVTRNRAGKILEDYKKRMRTELIVIDDFEEYNELLKYLSENHPRNPLYDIKKP